MTTAISLSGIFGTLSIMVLFYILARISERFGAVIKMAPIFRYYYVGLVFLAISLITHFVVVYVLLALEKTPGWVNSSLFLLLAYHLPLAIGLSLGLVITWRYWSWLVTEQNG